MSVEKVNKYKEEKKNRKANVARDRRQKKINGMIGWLIIAVLVVGIAVGVGLTAKNAYDDYKASLPDYDRDYITVSDMTGILTELESEDSTEDASQTETTESESTDAQ